MRVGVGWCWRVSSQTLVLEFLVLTPSPPLPPTPPPDGWFWQCVDGLSCKYKHSLPAGFVYKSKKTRDAEAALAAALETEVDITETIEAARARLPPGGTPVTAESFAKWKAARDARNAAALRVRAEEDVKRSGASAKDGRVLSGRALFTYDASLFVDDVDADAEVYALGDRKSVV